MKRTYMAMMLGAALIAAGCHRDMWQQPRVTAQSKNDFFSDNSSGSRIAPAGTVAVGQVKNDVEFYTGYDQNGKPVTEFPVVVDAELIYRGRERFAIFCTPCHGQLGDGSGMIAKRGFQPEVKVPSYHTDIVRDWPVGVIYDIISTGYGQMYAFGSRIEPLDRWAIVSYVKVLQQSQYTDAADLNADDVDHLGGHDEAETLGAEATTARTRPTRGGPPGAGGGEPPVEENSEETGSDEAEGNESAEEASH